MISITSSSNHAAPKASKVVGVVPDNNDFHVHVGKQHFAVEAKKGWRDTGDKECLQHILPVCDYDATLCPQLLLSQVGFIQHNKEFDRIQLKILTYLFKYFVN